MLYEEEMSNAGAIPDFFDPPHSTFPNGHILLQPQGAPPLGELEEKQPHRRV
jgi:hypothetical protein